MNPSQILLRIADDPRNQITSADKLLLQSIATKLDDLAKRVTTMNSRLDLILGRPFGD